MSVGTIITLIVIALIWGWIFYEMRIAPEVDENDNIIDHTFHGHNNVNSDFKDKKEDAK